MNGLGERDFPFGFFNYVSSCLFIERDRHTTHFFLFFIGAHPPSTNSEPQPRAAEKQKGGLWGSRRGYKQATRNRVTEK
jgi:hypothetical protein